MSLLLDPARREGLASLLLLTLPTELLALVIEGRLAEVKVAGSVDKGSGVLGAGDGSG